MTESVTDAVKALSDALQHASQQGDGSRPPIPAQPAPKFTRHRRIRVHVRAPFLPSHHGHARRTLIGKD